MLALLMLAAATLSACTPAPEPTPTPTAAFASEEEAFAAAEEVYDAYLAAAALRSDGDINADPDKFLAGAALEADMEAQRGLKEQGLHIVGPSTIAEFKEREAQVSGPIGTIVADVCVDISGSRVYDDSGVDVTPAQRPDRGQVRVEFQGDSEQLLIAQSTPSVDSVC